ncbi:hypothetical protein SEA_DOGGS_33 [Gordonia phage Doggs]|nr:hypothetical protein SEA_DOGGS_33 [Gordonia phage Doggs]
MAATFGYLVFLLRVSVTNRPQSLQRLSEAGADNADTLDLFEDAFEVMGKKFRRESGAEGFRCKEATRTGRTIWVTINKGPAGIEGETYDMETDESVETTERHALLSGLRAMFVVPADSYYGLMFVERIGRRNLRQLLDDWIIKPTIHQLAESLIRVEGFAEADDWRAVLADKELLQVSEVLKAGPGDDASTPNDRVVKVQIAGGAVRNLTNSVKEMIISRVQRRTNRVDLTVEAARIEERRHVAGKDAFTVEDDARLEAIREALDEIDSSSSREESLAEFLAQLSPVAPGGDLEHKSYDVAVGERRPERVFSVERESIPQFVYELAGRRLGDTELRRAWLSHAETILSNRGVTLPQGWAADTPSES